MYIKAALKIVASLPPIFSAIVASVNFDPIISVHAAHRPSIYNYGSRMNISSLSPVHAIIIMHGWVISAALKQWPLSICSRLFKMKHLVAAASDHADTYGKLNFI